MYIYLQLLGVRVRVIMANLIKNGGGGGGGDILI